MHRAKFFSKQELLLHDVPGGVSSQAFVQRYRRLLQHPRAQVVPSCARADQGLRRVKMPTGLRLILSMQHLVVQVGNYPTSLRHDETQLQQRP